MAPEMTTDLLCKRAVFFNSVHQVQQKFGSFDPKLVLRLVSVYSTSMYGSPLWLLDSGEHQKLNRSWNTAVKMIWNLPHATHTRLLEDLCPVPHLEQTLYDRHIGFVQGLSQSKKNLIRLIFRNCCANLSSVMGRNIDYLCRKFNFRSSDEMFRGRAQLKRSRVYKLPDTEKWKISLIEELALTRKEFLSIDFNEEHLKELLDHVCTK